ncbi:stearoyl-CoA desaturase 5-like [Anneissia japonica]|uniref:stearoyl-CoA desaturase 5-like n=1 Tax=Anneissia japonica TaxID=1529436 RepID=UPI0014254BC6|nr:stearoyl-CoA desaturase 5-like [Anneissia japonica]XP_033123117.1 stearoyl-CoA desaturase 5-like [Anneissia japonica]
MAPHNECNRAELLSTSGDQVIEGVARKRHHSDIVWRNVLIMGFIHLSAVYSFLFVTWKCHWLTLVWAVILYLLNGLGITAGAHRLWAHRSYKAKLPLRIFLAACNCIAFQNSIFEWARDHRVHHKYSETDADPHNAKRGFFFSHVGWLLVRKHPDVTNKGSRLKMDDLLADPVVRIQKKYYFILMPLMCFVLPTIIPTLWNESLWNAYFVAAVLRYCIALNCTWMVNSFAHFWGNRPYDKHINPAQNSFVAGLSLGEGWHNYHHTFPNDYRTGEFGWKLNPTTMLIDCMYVLGQAYDCNEIKHEVIDARRRRTGDRS